MRKQEIQNKKVGGEDCWATIFLRVLSEYNLQRLQSKPEELTEEEEMKQQRMMIMKDLMKKTRSKGRMDAENRWWVFCAAGGRP